MNGDGDLSEEDTVAANDGEALPIEAPDDAQSDDTPVVDEDVPQDTDVEPESEAAAAKPTRSRAKKTTIRKTTTRKKKTD